MFNYDKILENVLLSENKASIYHFSEETKINSLDKVSSGLFRNISEKAAQCDYSIAEKSRGDISRIQCYKDLNEGIKMLKRAGVSPNCDPDVRNAGNILDKANKALIENKNLFKQSFDRKNKMVQYIYSSFATTLITCTSLAVTKCSEMMKGINDNSLVLTENSGIKGLSSLSDAHSKGKLKKSLEVVLDVKSSLKEAVEFDRNYKSVYGIESVHESYNPLNEGIFGDLAKISTTGGKIVSVLGTIAWLLYSVRTLVYYYFLQKVKLSEYIANLAENIRLNARQVENDKARNRQEKIADKLESISERLKVDANVASERVKEEEESSNKEIDAERNSENNQDQDGDLGVF